MIRKFVKRIAGSVALASLLVCGAVQMGCQACGSCHDYSSPVANCSCSACGTGCGRSGSALTHGYAATEDATQSANSKAASIAQGPSENATR